MRNAALFRICSPQQKALLICASTEKFVIIQTAKGLEEVAFRNRDEYAHRNGGDDERTT